MNITKNNNKSDYRIANSSFSLQNQQNTNDTNRSNGYNINDTNSNNNNNNSADSLRFAATQSSPSLEDFTNTISIASINARGINDPIKFESILEDLTGRSLSVIGLQETKIKTNSAEACFHNFTKRNVQMSNYKAYWDYNPQDKAAGVGLLIASYISKYVQRIHRKDGRFIAIDLFLPAKKLKIINIYAHQTGNFATKGKPLTKFVCEHITKAESDGFQCIIMGDFNADPYKYHKILEDGRHTPPPFYKLVEFLTNRNYIDQSPKDINGKEFATFFANNKPTSRIDLIWYPDEMIRHPFLFDQVWQLPSSQLSTDSSACLDHRCIIVYFTKHLLLGHLPTHRVKQKGEWRTVFNLKQCKQKEWDELRKQVDERLQHNMVNSAAPEKSTLSTNKKSLNNKWQIFKDSVLQAAKASLKIKKRDPHIDNDISDKLITMRQHLTSLNKIFAFVTALVYPKALRNKSTTTIAQNQRIWLGSNKKQGLIDIYKDITVEFPFHIDNDEIPTVISNNTLPKFKAFRLKVAALRNLVRAQRSLLETSYNNELIKEYEQTRCANYVADKAAFIAFSLNKSKWSIVLDRAMNTHNLNGHALETEPVRVKELANEHFKTIAGIPPSTPPTIDDMSDRWQTAYLPSDEIDSTIYKDLLAPPTDEE